MVTKVMSIYPQNKLLHWFDNVAAGYHSNKATRKYT